MTLSEFIVPVVAFAVAGAGIWLLRREARNLEDSNRPMPGE